MINRDPKCVFVVDRMSKAEVIVFLLGENKIAAQVMKAEEVPGADNRIEIWVNDIADAERARELIAQRQEALREKAARTHTVKAECYACGKVGEFPVAEAGTVQACPHCGEYLEVPELESDLADPDME
jgi:hypothetical protein